MITREQMADYNTLAKKCAEITSSTRPPESMIMEIDVEGDDELPVDEEILKVLVPSPLPPLVPRI